MPEFRFIHCSDLHLDTPFSGLSSVHPALKEKLRDATFRAYQNIIDLALRERVDAVIIAGDVYDAADKSLQAQLKFRNGLKKLSAAAIPAFVVHGNHDPLDSWSASLEWPDNVTVFCGNKVERFPVLRDGQPLAHIYGISFPQRKVTDNLARLFKNDPSSGFAVGVLHTNVGGNPDHEDYAPCKVEDLRAGGMDYWALGHVHAHQVLNDHGPAIVYSGNSQARSHKEQGAKGCCLVTLREQSPPEVRFVAVDVVRYRSENLDISTCSTLDAILHSIRLNGKEISSQMDGRDALVRFNLTGRSAMHPQLHRGGTLDGLVEEVQDYFDGRNPGVWVDLTLDTKGIYDIDSLKQGNDFVADIISLYDETRNEAWLDDMKIALKPLFEDWQGQGYLQKPSEEELEALLEKAKYLTLDQLIEDH